MVDPGIAKVLDHPPSGKVSWAVTFFMVFGNVYVRLINRGNNRYIGNPEGDHKRL